MVKMNFSINYTDTVDFDWVISALCAILFNSGNGLIPKLNCDKQIHIIKTNIKMTYLLRSHHRPLNCCTRILNFHSLWL